MTKAVFCLANNDEQASRIIDRLLSSGFSNEDLSMLYPDRTKTTRNFEGESIEFKEFSTEKKLKRGGLTTEEHSKAPEGGVVGATAGGVIGGTLGLLAGIGSLAIPGFGPFIAAGPIVAALSGSAVGGSLGLLIGSIVGAGIPEYEAKKYESGLKAGNILISVHTDNEEEIKKATEIMKKEGAKDISSTREKVKSAY